MPAHARNVSPLARAIETSEPLARLAQRMRESQQRFACVRDLLPEPLASQLRPGPVDADGWTLLASNPAAAAKLRQLVPELESRLTAEQFGGLRVRVKVLPA